MYTTYRLGLTTYDLHYHSKGVLKYMAQQDCSRMVSPGVVTSIAHISLVLMNELWVLRRTHR